jgi:hypothetical protein
MPKFGYALKKQNWFKKHRVERLTREIALLEQLDASLWRKIVACSVVTIVGLAAALLGLAYMLHVHWGLAIAIPTCLLVAALVFWASRYEYGLLWLFIAVFFGILFFLAFEAGEIPDLSGVDISVPEVGNQKTGRKDERQAKIMRAIAKRKLYLEAALRNS